MNLKTNLFLIFIVVISSCRPEPETLFELIYRNETNSNIVLLNSFAHPDSFYTDTIFRIAPNTQRSISTIREGVNGINVYPHDMVFQIIPGDSITVIFRDTLFVVHYPERTTGSQGESLDSVGLLYSEPRNIYHAGSYFLEKPDNNYFQGTYTFTGEDLEYAISINE